jgi:hypothetical protein
MAKLLRPIVRQLVFSTHTELGVKTERIISNQRLMEGKNGFDQIVA